jgi:hypothetical protein
LIGWRTIKSDDCVGQLALKSEITLIRRYAAPSPVEQEKAS